MRLTLVRHGQTLSNVSRLLDTAYPGADLDETGRRQAVELAARFAGVDIDAIYVSDLARAWQTAEPLARSRRLEPVALAQLREIQAGDLEMAADWAPFVAIVRSFRDNLDARLPGGESGREFLTRFDRGIATIESREHRAPLVVSHGAALRMWIATRCHNITSRHMPLLAMDNTTAVVVEGSSAAGWEAISWGGAPIPALDEEPPSHLDPRVAAEQAGTGPPEG